MKLNITDIIFFSFCKLNYTLIIIGIVLIWYTFMLGTGRNRQPIENTMNISQYRQQPRPQYIYSQKINLEMSLGNDFPT